jgi:hypothetical protein
MARDLYTATLNGCLLLIHDTTEPENLDWQITTLFEIYFADANNDPMLVHAHCNALMEIA